MKLLKILIPILIIAAGAGAFAYMNAHKPPPKTRPKAEARPIETRVVRIENTDYLPRINAQGLVRAAQQSGLFAEVSGRIVKIAGDFAVGKRVKKDQTLVALDQARHAAQVAIAEADVTNAEAALIEEKARAQLALDNWKRSGNPGQPGELTRREPQLQAARATLKTARNRLKTARLDLAATRVRAPYDGVVMQTAANLGELVSSGVQLGVIMSTSLVEARVPLAARELALLPPLPLAIELTARQGDVSHRYAGTLVRREVAIDEQTRQLGLIAEITEPFDYPAPLLPGQFVNLSIPARKLANVAKAPLSAVTAGGEVTVIQDGLLVKKQVELVLTQEDQAIVRGLADGELLSVIALTNLPVGTRLKAVFEEEL